MPRKMTPLQGTSLAVRMYSIRVVVAAAVKEKQPLSIPPDASAEAAISTVLPLAAWSRARICSHWLSVALPQPPTCSEHRAPRVIFNTENVGGGDGDGGGWPGDGEASGDGEGGGDAGGLGGEGGLNLGRVADTQKHTELHGASGEDGFHSRLVDPLLPGGLRLLSKSPGW